MHNQKYLSKGTCKEVYEHIENVNRDVDESVKTSWYTGFAVTTLTNGS
jgi:hypothetical protein